MRHTTILTLLSAAMLTACSDSVESVDFLVSAPGGLSVEAGRPLCFTFAGNPDYITFFSGEDGCDYEVSDRLEADVEGLRLSCDMRQQYNDAEYLDRQLIYAYVSSDFGGDYTPEGINAATWRPLTGTGDNSLTVPVAVSATAVSTSGSVELGEYVSTDEPFYLAFFYNAPGRDAIPTANGSGRYMVRPRVDITALKLTKTLADGTVHVLDNASTDFGMRPVCEASFSGSNYRVNDDGVLFQPVKAEPDPLTGREPDERVWMVSTRINPRAVEPDRGLPIKSIAARLDSYEYVYNTPGTYVATFVATNANMWDSKRSVRQLTVTVR